MNEIGKKIREIRKQKGLSQEELAESATVNLRTIQRIESNESEPRGKTLNLICEVLGINAEDILDYGKHEDKSSLIIFHLSVLTFWIIPLGNIIIPAIIWVNKKDKVIGLKNMGIRLLNFQIIWSICTYLTIIAFALLKLNHNKYYHLFIYLWIILYALNSILPIIFAIRTKKGKTTNMHSDIIKLTK